jgi:hypothetical protein
MRSNACEMAWGWMGWPPPCLDRGAAVRRAERGGHPKEARGASRESDRLGLRRRHLKPALLSRRAQPQSSLQERRCLAVQSLRARLGRASSGAFPSSRPTQSLKQRCVATSAPDLPGARTPPLAPPCPPPGRSATRRLCASLGVPRTRRSVRRGRGRRGAGRGGARREFAGLQAWRRWKACCLSSNVMRRSGAMWSGPKSAAARRSACFTRKVGGSSPSAPPRNRRSALLCACPPSGGGLTLLRRSGRHLKDEPDRSSA